MSSDKELPYFYQERTKKRLWIVLWAFCIVSVVLEFFIHKRHSHFAESGLQSMDGIFGFYAMMGFVGCFILIIIAKLLGVFLKTKGDYYDGSN